MRAIRAVIKPETSKEKYLFMARAGAYAGKEETEAFRILVENFEERIHEERAGTIKARTKGFDQPGTSGPRSRLLPAEAGPMVVGRTSL